MAAPATTVVIPTRDRHAPLVACLESLAALRPPPGGFEVVVVDDGGGAPLEAALSALAGRVEVRLVRRPHAGGPAAARNEGAAQARGRLLAFTDDDCRVGPGWLAALVETVGAADDLAAGGITHAGLPGNPWARASAAVEAAVYAHENRDPDRARFLTPKNLVVPAVAFAAVGGFDPAFRWSEDRDFCDRWLRSGRRLAFVPGAAVEHDRPPTAAGFWRQHFEYGRGARRFHAARRRRGGPGLRPDPRFYVRLVRGGGDPRNLGLMVGAQLATAAGYVTARRPQTPPATTSSDGGSARESASASSRSRLTASGRAAR
jgi:GT2 family glycosyltransferase